MKNATETSPSENGYLSGVQFLLLLLAGSFDIHVRRIRATSAKSWPKQVVNIWRQKNETTFDIKRMHVCEQVWIELTN